MLGILGRGGNLADLFEVDLLAAALLPRALRLTCTCIPPVKLESDFDLIVRLRGAWGQKIRSRAHAGCPAADALLRACFGNGHAVRPYLIDVRSRDIYISVSLTLIGSAHIWQDCAFETFVAMLTEAPGIALTLDANSNRLPWRLLDARSERVEMFDPGQLMSSARVDIRQPLRLGAGKSLSVGLESLFSGLARRVRELAAWSHARVRPDSGSVPSIAQFGRVRPMRLEHAAFWRNSSRAQVRALHIGLIGNFMVEEMTPLGWALLRFGEEFGAGQEISLGLGRFDIAV